MSQFSLSNTTHPYISTDIAGNILNNSSNDSNNKNYPTKVQNDIDYANATDDTLTGDLNLNKNKIILKYSKAEIQHAQGDDFDGRVFRN